MDDYDADVARQARGPFTRVAERQLIRASTEHWSKRQRYSSERNRRIALYAKWISIVGGGGVTIFKIVEAILGKGF